MDSLPSLCGDRDHHRLSRWPPALLSALWRYWAELVPTVLPGLPRNNGGALLETSHNVGDIWVAPPGQHGHPAHHRRTGELP